MQVPPNTPDICGKCRGAHGPAKYRVRVNIYLLEDMPISSYHFELCEHCIRLIARASKRHKVTVQSCPYDAV